MLDPMKHSRREKESGRDCEGLMSAGEGSSCLRWGYISTARGGLVGLAVQAALVGYFLKRNRGA